MTKRTSLEIKKEIEESFGFFPPFFTPALSNPAVLNNLWQQTLSAYIENPLPDLFKEKLASLLSRYCTVPYCLICHSSALRPLGMSALEVLNMLEAPPLGFEELAEKTKCLDNTPIAHWPDPGSHLEECILCCCVAIFLNQDTEQCHEKLRQLLGEIDFSNLIIFLAYNRTALSWAEAHPELSYEIDQRVIENFGSLIEDEPRLGDFFKNYQGKMKEQGDRRTYWLTQENKRLLNQERSNRLKAEESEAHFRQLANSLPQMVYTSNPNGHLEWYNDVWYDYTQLPREMTGDESWIRSIPSEELEHTRKTWLEAVSSKKKLSNELLIKNGKTGELRWHLNLAVPILNEAGDVERWIGSLTDVHDQKSVVEKLKQEQDLREKFVAALTHDLRTPLAAAKMSAQLLTRKVPNELQRMTSRISDSMDRADNMIRDLLDASRIKIGEKIPLDVSLCDLDQITQSVVEELSTVHGDRFIVKSAKPQIGNWDSQALRRMLENLSNNAVKYGSATGPITITISKKENIVRIDVHNEGLPISTEDQKSIFEPYKRSETATKSIQKGWGIGLTLVKGFAEAHGGKIIVSSSMDRGTTFSIQIPESCKVSEEFLED